MVYRRMDNPTMITFLKINIYTGTPGTHEPGHGSPTSTRGDPPFIVSPPARLQRSGILDRFEFHGDCSSTIKVSRTRSWSRFVFLVGFAPWDFP